MGRNLVVWDFGRDAIPTLELGPRHLDHDVEIV